MDITYLCIIIIFIALGFILHRRKIQQGDANQCFDDGKQQQNQKLVVTSKSNCIGGSNSETNQTTSKSLKSQIVKGNAISGKRQQRVVNKNHSHPWLVTTLKGHTSDVKDMDFSNNGKYIASCGEDNNDNFGVRSSNSGNKRPKSNNYQNINYQNKTVSEDINSSCSNKDTSSSAKMSTEIVTSAYHVSVKSDKKTTIKNGDSAGEHNNRRQKSKKNSQNSIQRSINQDQQVNVIINADDDECKENQKPKSTLSSLTSTNKVTDKKKSPKKLKSSPLSTANTEKINTSTANLTSPQKSSEKSSSKKKNSSTSKILPSILRQYNKFYLKESDLVKFLRYYIIDPCLLGFYGYPIESERSPGKTEIFKCLPSRTYLKNGNDNNCYYHHYNYNGMILKNATIINTNDGLGSIKNSTDADDLMMQISSSDSGKGSSGSISPVLSSSSSPSSSTLSVVDSDVSETEENLSSTPPPIYYWNYDNQYQIYYQQLVIHPGHDRYNPRSDFEKKCVRCKRSFYVTDNGEYLTKEECTYHWGKTNQVYTNEKGWCIQYSCCGGNQRSKGCTKNRVHVWTGVSIGMNGPYTDFIRTDEYHQINSSSSSSSSSSSEQLENFDDRVKIYALDCEMCFTGLGLELTKITIINFKGKIIYEHYVKTKCKIVDYNTRFSGITEKHLTQNNNVKSFNEVQNDLLKLINSNTILIGHGLDNDLRVLKLIHKNIIDTSIVFPHTYGFPYRRALKTLTKTYLNRDIQISGDMGHNSYEDSIACLELMLWKIKNDFNLH